MNVHSTKRRYVAIFAITALGALAAAGIVFASADGNLSLTKFRFSPSTVPKKTYKNGSMYVRTATTFKNPSDRNLGGWTHRVQIWFDNDFKFNTDSVPKCSKNLANTTEAQAMKLCGNALVGKGAATATNAKDARIPGCVIVFNGAKNNQGQPTLILHSRFVMPNCSNPATNSGGSVDAVLAGVLKPANKAGYGKMLDVNNIDANPLPLQDFHSTIKRGEYVQARCSHKSKTWQVIGKHTYSDGQSNSQHETEKCTIG